MKVGDLVKFKREPMSMGMLLRQLGRANKTWMNGGSQWWEVMTDDLQVIPECEEQMEIIA